MADRASLTIKPRWGTTGYPATASFVYGEPLTIIVDDTFIHHYNLDEYQYSSKTVTISDATDNKYSTHPYFYGFIVEDSENLDLDGYRSIIGVERVGNHPYSGESYGFYQINNLWDAPNDIISLQLTLIDVEATLCEKAEIATSLKLVLIDEDSQAHSFIFPNNAFIHEFEFGPTAFSGGSSIGNVNSYILRSMDSEKVMLSGSSYKITLVETATGFIPNVDSSTDYIATNVTSQRAIVGNPSHVNGVGRGITSVKIQRISTGSEDDLPCEEDVLPVPGENDDELLTTIHTGETDDTTGDTLTTVTPDDYVPEQAPEQLDTVTRRTKPLKPDENTGCACQETYFWLGDLLWSAIENLNDEINNVREELVNQLEPIIEDMDDMNNTFKEVKESIDDGMFQPYLHIESENDILDIDEISSDETINN